MEFYTTFKEFKENYEKDLTEWLNTYPDGTEEEYLEVVRLIYKCAVESEYITVCDPDLYDLGEYDPFLDEYSPHIVDIISYIEKIRNEKSFNIIMTPEGFINPVGTLNEEQTNEYKRYCNIFNDYLKGYSDFIKLDKLHGLQFIEDSFRNFQYAKKRIYEFLNNRLEELKNPPQQTETETKQQKYSNPLKVKILDELNVQGWLLEKGFTVTQIQYLLSDLFDVTDKSIRNYFKDQKYTDKAKTIINEIKNSKSDR